MEDLKVRVLGEGLGFRTTCGELDGRSQGEGLGFTVGFRTTCLELDGGPRGEGLGAQP